MKRELGSFERALVISDRYAPFHSVYVLQLETPPPPQIVGRALKLMQKRHPLLRARLLQEGGKYFLANLIEPILPLHVLPRWNDTHWFKVVEVELEAHVEFSTDPMFRCTYLYDENQKQAEFILTFFQPIMDAASVWHLLDEFLATCASFMEDEMVTASELPLMPPQESRFPPEFHGFRLGMYTFGYILRQTVDEILYRIQTRGKRTPPLHEKPSHGHILSLCLPEAFVATLVRRTELEKITLPAILNAALLIAVNRHLYAGKKVPMRVFSFWDMRSYLQPPLPNGELGSFLSYLRHSVPVEGGLNVWQLARSLQQKFYNALKSGDHFVSAILIEALMKGIISSRAARLASTAMNFVGDSKLKSGYGEIIVKDLHGYVSAYEVGPEFSGQVLFFHGQLIWDFTYLEADMSPEEAKAILEEVKSILNSAMTSRYSEFN